MTKTEEKYRAMTTDEKISHHVKKFKGFFADVEKQKKQFVDGLLYQFAVTTVTLERLVDELNTGEILEDFSQGTQKFKRENPALRSYNTTIKSFTALSKSLLDLLPKPASEQAGEEIMKFITRPPTVMPK